MMTSEKLWDGFAYINAHPEVGAILLETQDNRPSEKHRLLAIKVLEELDECVRKFKPDIYVFDGNGYLHPRHMGIATHASFYLDKPTFGVAKSYFRVDKQTDYVEPESDAGSYTDIVIDGEVYGRALRTHKDVRPVFVSVGNHIFLDTACALALKLTDKESHVPVPTRQADLETHIERENKKASQMEQSFHF